MTVEVFRQVIEQRLTEKRYRHSLCVAEWAEQLAVRHGADPERCRLAGLIHDICKDTPLPEQKILLERDNISHGETLLRDPEIWHGIAGAVLLAQDFDVSDIEILNAVRYHTSARAGMSKTEIIIYLADKTSEDRSYSDVEHYRALAYESLDGAMRETLAFITGQVLSERRPIYRETCAAYNEYVALKIAEAI